MPGSYGRVKCSEDYLNIVIKSHLMGHTVIQSRHFNRYLVQIITQRQKCYILQIKKYVSLEHYVQKTQIKICDEYVNDKFGQRRCAMVTNNNPYIFCNLMFQTFDISNFEVCQVKSLKFEMKNIRLLCTYKILGLEKQVL